MIETNTTYNEAGLVSTALQLGAVTDEANLKLVTDALASFLTLASGKDGTNILDFRYQKDCNGNVNINLVVN